ncbi:MAG: hypothetical protein R2793_01930 [Flavobacteriaceae bacterium]
MKKLLNLKGAQELSKSEKMSITGGVDRVCPVGTTQYILPITQAYCAQVGGIWQNDRCYYCV